MIGLYRCLRSGCARIVRARTGPAMPAPIIAMMWRGESSAIFELVLSRIMKGERVIEVQRGRFRCHAGEWEPNAKDAEVVTCYFVT